MRTLAALLAALHAFGCATAGLNCDEKCATYGMACQGITSGTVSGSGYGSSGFTTMEGTQSGVVCRKPASDTESSAIGSYAATASEKEAKASKKNTLGWILGIGGLLVIGIAGSQRSSSSSSY
jgi:hypothetical protein